MDAIRISKVENVTLDRLIPPTTPSGTPSPSRQVGTLHLTPHHLIFRPSASASPDPGSSAITPAASTSAEEEVWISYPSITLFTRLPQTFAGKYPVQIRTRTFEGYVLGFDKAMEGGAEDVWLSVKDCAVASSVEQLYAFFYHLPAPTPINGPASSSKLLYTLSTASSSSLLDAPRATPVPGPSTTSASGWSTYNPRVEFARQGVGSRTKAWRFTDINKDYSYSPTYPAKMVVPSRISDSTLAYSGKYRSKARIPALSYIHWANQATITRSSQPMVGLKNARSAQDERLVECIFSSHHFLDAAYNASSVPNPLSASSSSGPGPIYGATLTNLIIDARPTTNAMANVAMGAGTENMENYRSAKKAYLGIDNIHVMRNSLKTVVEAIRDAESSPSSSSNPLPLDRAVLRRSNWLKHISTILDGSLLIVKNVHLNASHVLVHCSDGWDRTAQLSALAQICLDPYYRTFDGFKVLIEKDWLSFGHKFLDRSGHLSSEKSFTVTEAPNEDSDDEGGGGGGGGAQRAAQAFFASVQKQFNKSDGHLKEISPVFHQFLDCVRQIQRQFPDRFEFNEDFLLEIHHHLYSCQFGTFLFNNERERRVAESSKGAYVDRTVSAWDWFDRPEIRQRYINPDFNPALDDREGRDRGSEADQGVLLFDPRDVRFWFRLFRRGDEEMNGPKMPFLSASSARSDAQIQGQGADMVIVPPGQIDPVSAEGALEAVKAGVTGEVGDHLVVGPGTPNISRGPSPRPGGGGLASASTEWNRSSDLGPGKRRALDGPSGKGTFRGIENTSSAFSLQTAGHPSPNPDNPDQFGSGSASTSDTAYFPAQSVPGLPISNPPQPSYNSRNNAYYANSSSMSSSSASSSWNWSGFSSGAISALQRGAKGIQTIGEGAYNQIRAEMGEYDRQAQGAAGAGAGAVDAQGTGTGEGRPFSDAVGLGRGVRLPSEANPWSMPNGTGFTVEAASTSRDPSIAPMTNLPRTENFAARPGPSAVKQSSWSRNPWSDGPTGSSDTTHHMAAPATTALPKANGSLDTTQQGEETRYSLSKLRLGEEQTRDQPKVPAGNRANSSADEDVVRAAMGGDARAWDPLGAGRS